MILFALSIENNEQEKKFGNLLTWTDLGDNVTYTVYRRWAKATDKKFTAIKTIENKTSYFDPLKENQNGYTYYYYVVAEDANGNTIQSKNQKIVFKYGK